MFNAFKVRSIVCRHLSQSETCKQTGTAHKMSPEVVAAAIVSVLTVTVVGLLSFMFIILWFRIKSKSSLAIKTIDTHNICHVNIVHTQKRTHLREIKISYGTYILPVLFYTLAHTTIIQQHFKEYVI